MVTSEVTVEILFANRQLQRDCCETGRRTKTYGPKQAKLLGRRLDEMRAAVTLADLRTLPHLRCHELTANRRGQLSVDLKHPYRLIFVVEGERPRKEDGGLAWEQVKAIRIIEIEDTHG